MPAIAQFFACFVLEKVIAILLVKFDNNLFVFPITAFCSWINIFIFKNFAAKIDVGVTTKPNNQISFIF